MKKVLALFLFVFPPLLAQPEVRQDFAQSPALEPLPAPPAPKPKIDRKKARIAFLDKELEKLQAKEASVGLTEEEMVIFEHYLDEREDLQAPPPQDADKDFVDEFNEWFDDQSQAAQGAMMGGAVFGATAVTLGALIGSAVGIYFAVKKIRAKLRESAQKARANGAKTKRKLLEVQRTQDRLKDAIEKSLQNPDEEAPSVTAVLSMQLRFLEKSSDKLISDLHNNENEIEAMNATSRQLLTARAQLAKNIVRMQNRQATEEDIRDLQDTVRVLTTNLKGAKFISAEVTADIAGLNTELERARTNLDAVQNEIKRQLSKPDSAMDQNFLRTHEALRLRSRPAQPVQRPQSAPVQVSRPSIAPPTRARSLSFDPQRPSSAGSLRRSDSFSRGSIRR